MKNNLVETTSGIVIQDRGVATVVILERRSINLEQGQKVMKLSSRQVEILEQACDENLSEKFAYANWNDVSKLLTEGILGQLEDSGEDFYYVTAKGHRVSNNL